MKNFCIITNSLKDEDRKKALEVIDVIKEVVPGAEPRLLDVIEPILPVPEDTEAVLVLGGDGSLLSVAIRLRKLDIPLLGINLGHVGYLAEVEMSEIKTAITRLVTNDYTIEKRMMLAGSTVIAGQRGELDHALNDIVLSRRGDLQLAGYRIYVNGTFLTDYFADGMIISTPTGSTGYNLSAGGPIVEPSARLMLLTPVAPHTLNTRSIILSEDDQVQVELLPSRSNKEAMAGAYFDGITTGILKAGDSIEVRRSIRVCRTIKLTSDGFLQVLRKKLVN